MDTSVFPEPVEVYPESSFESAIAEFARAFLQTYGEAVIVPRFGLDIAVFTGGADGGRVALIEVKSFNVKRQGGIGFGNARGEGPRFTFFGVVQKRCESSISMYVGPLLMRASCTGHHALR